MPRYTASFEHYEHCWEPVKGRTRGGEGTGLVGTCLINIELSGTDFFTTQSLDNGGDNKEHYYINTPHVAWGDDARKGYQTASHAGMYDNNDS